MDKKFFDKKFWFSVTLSAVLLAIALLMFSAVAFAKDQSAALSVRIVPPSVPSLPDAMQTRIGSVTVGTGANSAFVVPSVLQVQTSPEFFDEKNVELALGRPWAVEIGGQKISLKFLKQMEPAKTDCGDEREEWVKEDFWQTPCNGSSGAGAEILVALNNGSAQVFSLALGEKIRIGGISIELEDLSGSTAFFSVFAGETSGAQIAGTPVAKNSPSANEPVPVKSGSSTAVSKGSKITQNSRIVVSVFPTKTFEVENEKMTEKFEIPPEIQSTAAGSQNISSVSVKPAVKGMRVQVQTSEGLVVQEIPNEFAPVMSYGGVQVEQDFANKKIILSQGKSKVETEQEIEIKGGFFVKSGNVKKKIEVLPGAAVASIEKQSGGVVQKTVLAIEGNNAFYTSSRSKEGKFFGIFPVKFMVESKVDAQSGELKVNQPFWSFLVSD